MGGFIQLLQFVTWIDSPNISVTLLEVTHSWVPTFMRSASLKQNAGLIRPTKLPGMTPHSLPSSRKKIVSAIQKIGNHCRGSSRRDAADEGTGRKCKNKEKKDR